jgi:hypothetical protein
VGYLIGNEVDKSDAQKRAAVTAAEMQPFAGTTWQLLSVNPPAPRPVSTLIVNHPGYLINAHYGIDGDRLYLNAGDRSAVLKGV